jgi:hypothetical protein
MDKKDIQIMDAPILYLPTIPQCQFCQSKAKYEARSTEPDYHSSMGLCVRERFRR